MMPRSSSPDSLRDVPDDHDRRSPRPGGIVRRRSSRHRWQTDQECPDNGDINADIGTAFHGPCRLIRSAASLSAPLSRTSHRTSRLPWDGASHLDVPRARRRRKRVDGNSTKKKHAPCPALPLRCLRFDNLFENSLIYSARAGDHPRRLDRVSSDQCRPPSRQSRLGTTKRSARFPIVSNPQIL
jgi:hypothetical protein